MSDFYNKYPYTDFHELNLDWVIDRVKKLTEDWLATQEAWNNTQEQWQQLYDYVHDYFANLDVQDEINAKINAMILDGSFATIVTPIINAQVADTVAAWLAEHITPTTPAVDDTLTVSGAAADSKTVGDKFAESFEYRDITGITDLNDAYENGFYNLAGNTSYTNQPDSVNGPRMVINYNHDNTANALTTQYYVHSDTGVTYIRRKPYGDSTTWTAWANVSDILGSDDYQYRNPTGITDLNDMTENGWYALAYNYEYTNMPNYVANRKILIVLNNPYAYTVQMLYFLERGDIYLRSTTSDSWTSWKQCNQIDTTLSISGASADSKTVGDKFADSFVYRDITGITDLNDTYEYGFYILAGNTTYTNQPDSVNGPRMIVNYNYDNTATAQTTQYYVHSDTGVTYIRRKPYGDSTTWTAWVNTSDIVGIRDFNFRNITLVTDNDLNNAIYDGWYYLGYNTVYTNEPVANPPIGRKMLATFSQSNSFSSLITQIIFYFDGSSYIRSKPMNDTFSAWTRMGYDPSITSTKMLATSQYLCSAADDNTGLNINFMTYNVANYNNDTTTYISDEKLFNFKCLLSEFKPDFIGVQEDRQYLDADSMVEAKYKLYMPVFPRKYGIAGVTLYSKFGAAATKVLAYTNGRTLRYATFNYNGKILLLISTHPVAGTDATAVSQRAVQYEELLKWVSGLITLNEYGTSTAITVPTHEWCVITADMNSTTADDKSTLTTLCRTYGFTMANGDWMGWINTYANNDQSIDNIIVNSKVTINSVICPNRYKSLLYSDHLPLIANCTLR